MKTVAVTFVFMSLLCGQAPVLAADTPLAADRRFAGFDTIAYVKASHPALADNAEAISHFAGYYRINPLLFSALVAKRKRDGAALSNDIIENLAKSLSALRDRSRSDAIARLGEDFKLGADGARTLLQEAETASSAAGVLRLTGAAADRPPAMDLPFARDQAWVFNGVHTWTGSNNGSPMSSIDVTRSWNLRWGNDTSDDWVTAAHDGIVTVFSRCFVGISHDSGWQTHYYHLDNVQVQTGNRVRAGDRLANYANSAAVATCSGGSSTGPHLHFALLKDGIYHRLDGIALSGYQVHPGKFSYDSSPAAMWLEKRGQRYFAFSDTVRTEPGDNAIDYRYNGMWYSPDHSGHGLNVSITETPDEASGSRKTLFAVLFTYDDDGRANFYVGNRDFERWRSDEQMTVTLLQTAGGDFTLLSPIDFNRPGDAEIAGELILRFDGCIDAEAEITLDERVSGQPVSHTIRLTKLIGVPDFVCAAASQPLPGN